MMHRLTLFLGAHVAAFAIIATLIRYCGELRGPQSLHPRETSLARHLKKAPRERGFPSTTIRGDGDGAGACSRGDCCRNIG